jgi:hypothetical protein
MQPIMYQSQPQMQPQPIMYQQPPIQPIIYQQGQTMPSGTLNFVDREEIRSMISRYSEDTEKLLKDYISKNNENMIKYVKELIEYKKTMNDVLLESEKKEKEEKQTAANNSAGPIINAINSVPRQIGSIFKSVTGAVGNVVNTANQSILGKTPQEQNQNQTQTQNQTSQPQPPQTPSNQNQGQNNEADIDVKLKENPQMLNNKEPEFKPVSDAELENEKNKLAKKELEKVNTEVSNLFNLNLNRKPATTQPIESSRINNLNQKGGGIGKIRKLSRKKSKSKYNTSNKINKKSRVKVKK